MTFASTQVGQKDLSRTDDAPKSQHHALSAYECDNARMVTLEDVCEIRQHRHDNWVSRFSFAISLAVFICFTLRSTHLDAVFINWDAGTSRRLFAKSFVPHSQLGSVHSQPTRKLFLPQPLPARAHRQATVNGLFSEPLLADAHSQVTRNHMNHYPPRGGVIVASAGKSWWQAFGIPGLGGMDEGGADGDSMKTSSQAGDDGSVTGQDLGEGGGVDGGHDESLGKRNGLEAELGDGGGGAGSGEVPGDGGGGDGDGPNEPDVDVDDLGNSSGDKEFPTKILKPFARGKPNIEIDQAMAEALATRGSWRSIEMEGKTATSYGILDVKAPPEVVMEQLLDFDDFPRKVSVVGTAEVYKREEVFEEAVSPSPSTRVEETKPAQSEIMMLPDNENGHRPNFRSKPSFPVGAGPVKVPSPPSDPGQTAGPFRNKLQKIFVKFHSPVVPGIKLTVHLAATYEPAKNSYTFTLDDTKPNDFLDTEGHWHVEPHPDNPSESRVYFEIALVAPDWLPRWVFDQLTKVSIKDATQWVKPWSEKQAARELGLTTPRPPVIEQPGLPGLW